jgi:hypothetical protein
MPDKVRPSRSYTANSVPLSSELTTNEIAINYADSRLYYKTPAGAIQFITLGGGGGGGSGGSAVVEAATTAGFPATGASQTLYVSRDSSRVYRFDSSGVYIELGN